MKNKKILFFAFAAIVLLIPIYIAANSQYILSSGTLYKFRPAVYDPFDPFRGKYLQINYDTRNIPTNEEFKKNDDVYVSIGVDEDGYAYFKEAFKTAPTTSDYLVSTVSSIDGFFNLVSIDMEELDFDMDDLEDLDPDDSNEPGPSFKGSINIKVPDNMCKYFINEDDALRAEIVFDDQRDSSYVGVRILNGSSRLEDIYIKNKPILDYLHPN
ncbi:MAG: putative membrane-anchored protein [Crocinitomicaceae bacterium]|jgi:uncharacterized membrane-anchored protein